MINLLLGVSGSGKSYEANVFHILYWLSKGRKVITNLPVIVEAYTAIEPGYADLLEVRKKPQPILGRWEPTREEGAFVVEGEPQQPAPDARAFAGVWDYYDTWRHPDPKKAWGAVFVLDEAQYFIPAKESSREVEEWYALHRHFNQDVLLLTQSYGKLSRAVVDNVQVVYRCRKNVALGSPSSYTRKVQDGIRGEVVNTTIRRYDPKYFKLYRSHTQGNAAAEFNATDVRPLWKHWSVIGAGICFSIVFLAIVTGNVNLNPSKAAASGAQQAKAKLQSKPVQQAAQPVAHAPQQAAPLPPQPAASQIAQKPANEPDPDPEPYAGREIHLVGVMRQQAKVVWSFVLSQNGMPVSYLSDADLKASGYVWNPKHDCGGVLVWKGRGKPIVCDLPTVKLTPAAGTQSS